MKTDLNKLKEEAKRFKAPEDILNFSSEKEERMNGFIETLKAQDEKDRKKTKSSLIFFIIAAILFGVAFFASIFTTDKNNPIGSGDFHGILSMIFYFIVFLSFKKLKKLRRIVYNEPIKLFLEKAEKRYRFYGMESWFIATIGCLILYAGAMYFFVPYLKRVFLVKATFAVFVLFTLFYIGACLAGFYFTHKDWIREKKDIWLSIKQMQLDLEISEEI